MVEFVNKLTNTSMWVADDRVEEYKAAGHKPAVSSSGEPVDAEVKKSTPKKK